MGLKLLLGIHNHQPVGNFDHVFKESVDRCYRPQLEILSRFPDIKVAYHHSGSLFEWIENNSPDYLELLSTLVDRSQVELLSGGFYEPILSSIPVEDAVGQLDMMNEYIKKRFGTRPTGLWMAERVWDPHIPLITSLADLKFTLLDDTHLIIAGLSKNEQFGYHLTEKNGELLAIFPIDKNLRYSIPFHLPEENLNYFIDIANQDDNRVLTYGDDGEKFGLWPDSYDWVYNKRWLENFYTILSENRSIVETTSFKEILDQYQPSSKLYIPPSSYEEMMEWSLAVDKVDDFIELKTRLEESSNFDRYQPFLRGGLWHNFHIKYDESNRLNKKALYLSKMFRDAKENLPDNIALEIERLLYQGECNCAYWHGSFGGLYLSHLRHALYSALIKGEKILEEALNENQKWLNITIADYDRDLSDEITLSNPELTVIVDCNYGGSLLNLDYKPEAFALSNTIRRRKEFYHKKIETIASSNDGDQPRSIHDFVQAKEEGLEDFLQYDKYLRRSFLEYLFVSDIDFETFNKGEYENIEGITDAPYNITKLKNKDGSTIPLINANFRLPVEPQINLDISKEFVMNDQDPSLEVRYQLSSDKLSNREFFFLTELNFNLLTDQSDDRYWSAGNIENQRPLLRETLIEDDVTKVGLVDDYFKFEIIVSSSTPITVWRYPIYTISQSEGGFERTYQGSTLMLKRKIRFLQDEKVSFSIKVEINKRD